MTAMKGPEALLLSRWMVLAASSLPVPLSPVTIADASVVLRL